MKLAVFLLLLVAATHYGYDVLAMSYADPVQAGKAWFYILRGVEGAALFGIVAAMAKRPAVFIVCLFGMVEESQTAICRASLPIAEQPAVAAFSGLCGSSWAMAWLFALALAGLGILYELGRLRGKKRH